MKKLISLFILLAVAASFAQSIDIYNPYPTNPSSTPGVGGPCTSSSQCGYGTAWTCSGPNGYCIYHACNCGNRCGDGVCGTAGCLACSTACPCSESTSTCPEDCPPPCTSQCSSGQTQCNGNVAQTCVQSGNCWIWSNSTCSSGYTCSSGTCVPSCSSYCSYTGQTQCVGSQIMTCGNYDADPCLEWSTASNCPSGQTCSGGSCVATCSNDCISGSTGCTTSAQKWTCGYNSVDSCLHNIYSYCASGYNCVSGNCVLGCTNECSSGQTGCSSSFQRWYCGEAGDGDICLDKLYANCGSAQTCSGGTCYNNPSCSVSWNPASIFSPSPSVRSWSSSNANSVAYSCSGPISSSGSAAASGSAQINFSLGQAGTEACTYTVIGTASNSTCSASLPVRSCTNQCTAGQTQCSGTQLQTCAQNASGCYLWGAPANCSSGLTCSAGVCVGGCSSPCAAGAIQCAGTELQICSYNSSLGCYAWSHLTDCPTAQQCMNKACMGPEPACLLSWTPPQGITLPGTLSINVNTSYATSVTGSCILQAGMTNYTILSPGSTVSPNRIDSVPFNFAVTTPPGNLACSFTSIGLGRNNTCSANMGIMPVCTNQCSLGQSRCSGSQLQTCIQSGNCYIWSGSSSCPLGQICSGSSCQPMDCSVITRPDVQWITTSNGGFNDRIFSIRQTTDGGYIYTGQADNLSLDRMTGNGAYMLSLTKTNANGIVSWSRNFSAPGYDGSYGTAVRQTGDGGYIAVGYTMPAGSSYWDGYAVRTDSNGNLQWSKTYGGANSDILYSVELTSDGGYIMSGFNQTNGVSTAFLIKTDANGNPQWGKTYGANTSAFSAIPISGGYTWAGGNTLAKTDSNGNALWTKTYSATNIMSVTQTLDGGYLLHGYDTVKTDSNGNAVWQKQFLSGIGTSATQSSDGNFVLAGYGGSIVNTYSFYVVKANASNGNLLWNVTYLFGNKSYAQTIQQTSDGGYVAAGYYVWQTATNPPIGMAMLKLGPDCGILQTCTPQCTAGQTQCSGTQQQTCTQNSTGCYVWGTPANCPSGQTCSGTSCISSSCSPANPPLAQWSKNYGGSRIDFAGDAIPVSDGGYIIAADGTSYGAGDINAILIKADANGNLLWNKTFGSSSDDELTSVQQTSDGGYALGGYYQGAGGNGGTFWLLKTDANGNAQLDRKFSAGRAYAVQQTSDSGYVLIGISTTSGPADQMYGRIVKTDSAGNLAWDTVFRGSATYGQQTSDGGYIATGYISNGFAEDDVLLVKIGASGNILWNKTIGTSEYEDAYGIQQTSDGGYIIAGTRVYNSTRPVMLLIRADSAGNVQWTKTFEDYTMGRSVRQTPDGGYVVFGASNYSAGSSNEDYMLLKTDANGNAQWSKSFGGSGIEYGYSVRLTPDQGYLIAGQSYSYGNGDALVFKLGGCANCTSACTLGDSTCSGSQVRRCAPNSDGCYAWGTPVNCPSGQTCSGAACSSIAANSLNVILQSPVTNYNSTSPSVTFSFIATNTLSPTMNCALLIDSLPWTGNSATPNNTLTSFTLSNISASFQHYWEVNCTATK